MNIIRDLRNYKSDQASVMTIGTFDGVHIGHRKILERLIHNSKTTGLQSTLLTFFPHPRMVLQKDRTIHLLNTIEEKSEILEKMGLDCLIIHPFSLEFSRLSATDFVRDILVNKLHTKKIIIGYDHRFGRNRAANIQDLQAFGSLYDFSVEEIQAQEIDEISVSSTKIRKALNEGDIKTANAFLGYHYSLKGTVSRGEGLGRKLGFPTANLSIEENYKLIPRQGAYLVKAAIESKSYFGMMNIGTNPTVSGKEERIEVHFFELNEDLYGKQIRVSLIQRLRDEIKFKSLEALKSRLETDKSNSLKLIQEL